VPSSGKIVAASLFGDLFVARDSGEVMMLDLVSGELKQIAACIEEFESDLTQPERRQEWLMQDLADAAFASGIKPVIGKCLAFRTPPMLGGSLKPENLVRWNFTAYHCGLAQLFLQIKGLPLGTQVVVRPAEPAEGEWNQRTGKGRRVR
jgi:hypothetical protein